MRMVSGRTFTVVLVAVVGGAAFSPELLACGHDCQPNPDPVEIGVLPGYQLSRVKQINNRGDIVGQSVRTSEEPTQQAVLWHKVRGPRYRAEELPALEGFLRGDARGFATPWIPVGISYIPGSSTRAVAWKTDWAARQRVAVDLEPPPGFTDAQAFSGNGLGLVAGDVSNPKELIDGLAVRHAVLWLPTRRAYGFNVCDLGVPEGFLTSSANGVSARGFVVGTARGRSAAGGLVTTAFVWRPMHHRGHTCQFEAIPLPSGEAAFTVQAPAINDHGDVVAQGSAGASSSALLWRRHRDQYADPEVLPLPKGFTDALARAINNSGDIVGTAQRRTSGGIETRVVLWRRTHHGWASSVLTSPPSTNIINSEHLNDRGDVIADTTLPPSGSSGAYLWVKAKPRYCGHGAGWEDATSETPAERGEPSDTSADSPPTDVP